MPTQVVLISVQKVIAPEDLEICGVLGAGGFGQVYHGKWNGPEGKGRRVAIKEVSVKQAEEIPIITQVNTADGETVTECCREAKLPGTVGKFPVLCEVYGVSYMSDTTRIVMQFFYDGDLHHHLSHLEAPLPLWKQLRFCWNAAQAVDLLHSNQPPVLHRDIKSHNFVVLESHIALTDFGLAKSVRDAGNTLGTLAWTPPEVLNETSAWTTASDIYSLGMVFYEIVSSKMPFEGLDNEDIKPNVLSGVRPEIPGECPQVIMQFILHQ